LSGCLALIGPEPTRACSHFADRPSRLGASGFPKPQLPTQSVIALHAHPTFRFASSLPASSRSLVCALALIRRAIILCVPGLLATIFLLLFVLLYAFVRQSSHCNTTASRYASHSEMPDAKKPLRRNAERLFQKLLNRTYSCLIVMPEIVKISLLMLRV
jgi:hypothetical protein